MMWVRNSVFRIGSGCATKDGSGFVEVSLQSTTID